MLTDLVVAKIGELGTKAASEYFGVGEVRLRQWVTGSKPVSLAAAEKVYASQQSPVLEGASWEGQEICLCAPFYKSVTPSTMMSVLGLWDRPKMKFLLNHGDAFISHSRNTLAKRFLALNIPWSFWIDDDVIAPNGSAAWFNKATGLPLPDKVAGQHAINRLLSHKKTLVGGLYFGRDPQGKPMFAEGYRSSAEATIARQGWSLPPEKQLRPTKWVATGCLLIHREVFLAISKKFPELDGKWFSTSEHQLVGNAKRAINELSDLDKDAKDRIASAVQLLTSSTDAPIQSGEDVIFCRRAAEAGHQPHVDLGLPCGHIGSAVYHGSNTRS
jgi:hypothetical protein